MNNDKAEAAAVPIGEAAQRTGVKIPTIRYYEQIGLLPAPVRTDGNRRLYQETELRRLSFIRHARELGFDLKAIRALLSLQDHPEQSCASADAIARARLAEVRQRIARLKALEDELTRMIDECARGRIAECRVIETLAQLHTHGTLA
ncbi:MAG: helix-turn-helix domain-containing protein [Xanthobacteraceae bacterium]